MTSKSKENQLAFLARLEQIIPDNQKLSEVLAQNLGISIHGAYRRMNGKSDLSFEEAAILNEKYQVFPSAPKEDVAIPFSRRKIIRNLEDIKTNLGDMLMMMKAQLQFPDGRVYYSTKDIPVLYHFAYPDLAAFKVFTWLNSVGALNEENKHFRPEEFIDFFQDQWKGMMDSFSQIPGIEIWSEIAVLNFIRQLEYYFDARLIRNKQTALNICEQYKALFEVIEKQAVYNCKIHPNDPVKLTNIPYELYFNELLVMENSALLVQPERKIFFQSFAYFNFTTTTDPEFCDEMDFWFHAQIQKSINLSNTREKERNQYFGKVQQELTKLMDRIVKNDLY
ncbi:hypothetical protein KFE98_10875 [bacterium SCSIO 12741]|nr:hypothetical protein KFE98_10875 [bacterium SCSIO 12741]